MQGVGPLLFDLALLQAFVAGQLVFDPLSFDWVALQQRPGVQVPWVFEAELHNKEKYLVYYALRQHNFCLS